jgi:hypothetical protein
MIRIRKGPGRLKNLRILRIRFQIPNTDIEAKKITVLAVKY